VRAGARRLGTLGAIALRVGALLAMVLLVTASSPAWGKPARAGRAAGRSAPRAVATRRPAPTGASVAERAATVDKTATATERDPSAGKTNGAETATGPSGKIIKTKTYTFGAMDVEGKLKTPQLLYFLNRVKLELDMSAPDKRSFMKELAKSSEDKNL
jgi:hypothetical protein